MKKALVIENEPLTERIGLLSLKVDQHLCMAFNPGQFLKIGLSDGRFDPLFPRPFTVHSLQKNTLRILYQVVGKGTRALRIIKAGSYVEVLAPLGQPYPKDIEFPLALVGGGVGVAGFGFLLERLSSQRRKETALYYGASKRSDLVRLDYFKSFEVPLRLATEDGSLGFKGYITDLLEKDLKERCFRTIIACGPLPMLKRLKESLKGSGIKLYLSLENFMACGTGFCMGCVLPKRSGGYVHLCKDGPTLLAEEIEL
ncbi:MAG: hypothetical protein N2327_04295 [Caldimicrobium sp.]|nr:hypothetical protein [Caldimicrobium sp.]MCX7873635.1 hypothetical protein [Caldimicrobium sp.]MDW8094326.1 hypothetical protein [Caldimicrobium sp.]